MIMSSEDKHQECERIRLEHPDYHHGQIYRDLRDVEKSASWSDSWANKFPHVSFNKMISIDIDMPSINPLVNYVFSYNPFKNIEDLMDLENIINLHLNKQEKTIIRLILKGYKRKKIAKFLKVTENRIGQIYRQTIEKMREYYYYAV